MIDILNDDIYHKIHNRVVYIDKGSEGLTLFTITEIDSIKIINSYFWNVETLLYNKYKINRVISETIEFISLAIIHSRYHDYEIR